MTFVVNVLNYLFVNFCYIFISAISFVECTFQTLHLVLAFWYVILCCKILFLKKKILARTNSELHYFAMHQVIFL